MIRKPTYEELELRVEELEKEASEHQRIDEALRESEMRLKSAQSIAKIGNWSWDIPSDKVEWSDQLYEIFKAPRKEPTYEFVKSFVHPDDLDLWQNTIQQAVEEQKPFTLDYRAIRSDGKTVWVHDETRAAFNEQGELTGFQGTAQDITERKQAEEEIRVSEQFRKSLLDCSPNPILVIKTDTSMEYVNPALIELTGFSEKELLGIKAPYPWWTKETIMETGKDLKEAMRNGAQKLEELFQKKNGERFWVEITSAPVRKSGEFKYYLANWVDVTERKRTEEALKGSEEKYRIVTESSLTGIFIHQDGRYVFVNKRFAELHGYEPEELLGKEFWKLIPPDEREEIEIRISKRLKGEFHPRQYERRRVRKNGEVIWVEIMADVIEYEGKPALMGNVIDINERKKAEKALLDKSLQVQRLAEELELIIDGVPGLVFFKDTENRFVRVNKFVADAHQMTKKQLEGTSCFELYSREMAQTYFEDDLEVIRSRRPRLNFDEKWETEYGTRWINTNKIPYLNEKGEVTGVIGLSLDITERKKAEEALRESEEKYRSLVESTEDSIYLVDRDCAYLFMNKEHLSKFGVPKDKVLGRRYEEFHSKEETEEFKVRLNEVIKTGESNRYTHESERVGGHYDRTLSPVKDWRGNIVAVTVVSKDITKLKRAEEALKQTNEDLSREHNQRKILSKMLIDLLEKDRRQIAMELHDHIGQILTSLKIDIEMIHGKLKPEQRELGARITAAQERTIQAIKDVKNISRGLRPSMLDALGLVPSLRELFNEIQRQTDIKIRFFSRNIPKRFAPEKELAIYRIVQEALTNIVKHARAKKVFVNLVNKGEKLSLSAEDDGVGFDQNKVMAFSKKKGPLGILIMRERAEQIDGEFTLESQIGKGTHLLVEIPLD